jgi:signal transduction histidine kinase
VERIRTAAWHLLGLIEQILIYARLEVGRERVHVEKVPLDRVLRDAAELIEPVASEKGLQFHRKEPEAGAYVETDVTKLRQILLNLLSNAVKFTDAGKVELEARVTDSGVEFMVHDTGVGIAPEHQQRVFDSFWQVDQSATRKEGGTGIGLSVSRKLARLLGGDISVRSTPQQGTTFTLQLPHRLDENTANVIESV